MLQAEACSGAQLVRCAIQRLAAHRGHEIEIRGGFDSARQVWDMRRRVTVVDGGNGVARADKSKRYEVSGAGAASSAGVIQDQIKSFEGLVALPPSQIQQVKCGLNSCCGSRSTFSTAMILRPHRALLHLVIFFSGTVQATSELFDREQMRKLLASPVSCWVPRRALLWGACGYRGQQFASPIPGSRCGK